MTDHLQRILVLCTGNSCRSQMAEGFLRHLGDGGLEVYSAGVAPAGLSSRAVTVMAEAAVDISNHTSKSLDIYSNDEFDFVITVCDNAATHCPVFPGGGDRLHWPFDDPADFRGSDEESLDGFRRVRDEIKARVLEWLGTIGRLRERSDTR